MARFLTTLKSLLSRSFKPSGRLDQVLILAYGTGGVPLGLVCERLTPTTLCFHTSSSLRVHQCIPMQLLIPGQAPLNVEGRVRSWKNGKGRMELTTSEFQQQVIACHLRGSKRRARRAFSSAP
jgi:hypothetical protein